MIKLKPLILEKKYNCGCIMAQIGGEVREKILEFNKSIICDDIIYNDKDDNYGRENDPHVTLKFGLTESYTKDEMQEFLKDVSPFIIKIKGIGVFENDEFDVIKLEIEGEELKKLHKQFSKLPNEDEHPIYHPHCTLAYVKSGEGKKFKEKNAKKFADITIDKIVYSNKGNKTHYTLKESVNEGTRTNFIDQRLDSLEKEWDRLDHMGGQETRQLQISNEIEKLRSEKAKWDKIHTAIREIEYPLAKGDEVQSYAGSEGWKGKLVWMSPDKFLNLALPLTQDNTNQESIKNLKNRFENRLPTDCLVLLVNMNKKKVVGHEGRHRATVAKDLGIEKVPVLIYTGSGFKRVPEWNPEDHSIVDKIDFEKESPWSNI